METPSDELRQACAVDARESDVTLIVVRDGLSGRAALTVQIAECRGKICMVIGLDKLASTVGLTNWLRVNNAQTLNVARPRKAQRLAYTERSMDTWLIC